MGFDPAQPFEVHAAPASPAAFDPAKPFAVHALPAFDPTKPFSVGGPDDDELPYGTGPTPYGLGERNAPAALTEADPATPSRAGWLIPQSTPAPEIPAEQGMPPEAQPAQPGAQDAIAHTGLGEIARATKEGYESTPPLINPDSAPGKWLRGHGMSGLTMPLAPLAGLNAGFRGAQETVAQLGAELGYPGAGRDAAAYIESLGMTGAPAIPHAPGMPHAELLAASEGRPTAALPTLEKMAADAVQRAAERPGEPAAPEPAAPMTPERAAMAELEPLAAPAAVETPPEVVAPAEPPQAKPAEAAAAIDAPLPAWMAANAHEAVRVAAQTGLTPEVRRLALDGKTAAEISESLGGKLSPAEVRAVRDSLGIEAAGPAGFALGPDIPRSTVGNDKLPISPPEAPEAAQQRRAAASSGVAPAGPVLDAYQTLEQGHYRPSELESFAASAKPIGVVQDVGSDFKFFLRPARGDEHPAMWLLSAASEDGAHPVVLSPAAIESRMTENSGRPLQTTTHAFFKMTTQTGGRAFVTQPAWVKPDGRGNFVLVGDRGRIADSSDMRPASLRPVGGVETHVDKAAAAPPEPQPEPPPSPRRPFGRAPDPYETIPREPTRLINYLIQKRVSFPGTIHEQTLPGGLQDSGGDLKAILGGRRGRPGLINKAGRTLDDAAEAAWEAGYFPTRTERPTINDLLDAIAEDHRGNPQYSHFDADRAEAFNSAVERNSEVDRLADQFGINQRGMTRDQFFDEIADRLSSEDAAREISEREADFLAAQKDLEAAAKKESVAPEPWNAQDFYGQSQARSLEDLEREYREETSASAPEQREPVPEGPRPAASPEGAGEGSEGQGRGVAGTPGGGGTEGAGRPTTDLLGRPTQPPATRATPEPTIRTDPRQTGLPGTEASAVQAQASRDAGRGTLTGSVTQKPANEGLFAPDTSGQGKLYSFPAVLFDKDAWRRVLGSGNQKALPAFEALRDKSGIGRAVAEIKAGLAPTSLRGAKPMERQLRAHNAESAQAYDRSFHALEKVRAAVDRLPKEAQVDFTDRMERGATQPTPELQAVADALRGQLDGWARKIQGLGKGYLASAVENYMGHIWGNYAEWAAERSGDLLARTGEPKTQADMEQAARAAGQARRPLRGSGSFLKQRSFPTQLEGIEAGLEPVTYNPVDLQLIKLHEMQKFYHGTQLAENMKQSGLAKWVPWQDEHEARMEGLVALDDKIFRPRLTPGGGDQPGAGHNNPPEIIGRTEMGNWYAPEPAARVFNNYMSQGWHGQSTIYDAVRRGNNALNTLQLGFSGFHATFVTMDTAISKVALGLQQIAQGHGIRGAGNLLFGTAGFPASIVQTVRRGSELRRAWYEPENATPEMHQILDALKTGGGRVNMPRFFQTSASGAFFNSLADLRHPSSALYSAAQMFRDAKSPLDKAVMTPLRIAGRLIDTINQPLMGALVPRAKLGVFADMAQNWLRDHPGATHEELSDAMIRFQDSVDNRLGQLNYDNLFWNKVAKDIAFVTTRSVGWNLGTVREIGGAFVDGGAAIKAIANGRAPQLTTRMAYTIALPIVTMQIGAILTYLATGKPPQQLMDYFYPPSGGDDGERRAIPGYMKDVIAFRHSPVQTALNKTAPMLEAVQELVKNRDYYGGIIYDPLRDKGPTQAYGDWLLNQTSPFSFRGWNRMSQQGAPALEQSLNFFGFQPAPKSITDPERGEAFQMRDDARAFKRRVREPGRFDLLNAPPQ